MARGRKPQVQTAPAPAAAPMASGMFKAPLSGYFAVSPSKTMTILPEQPLAGWVTLAFTDAGDEFHLQDQLMYVPREHFEAAIKQYLGTHPIEG